MLMPWEVWALWTVLRVVERRTGRQDEMRVKVGERARVLVVSTSMSTLELEMEVGQQRMPSMIATSAAALRPW